MLRRPLLFALVAGLVSATGFAPLQWWPLTLAALAALLLLVHRAPSLRAALLRGWVFGVGHFTVGNNWIQHAFTYQDKMPPWLGYFAVVALALYLAVYPAIAAGITWQFGTSVGTDRAKAPGAALAFAGAAAWILGEWLRATLFTGYPWNPMGVIWLPLLGIAGAARWIGTYALSGVTMLAAGALLLALHGRWRLPAGMAAVGLLLVFFNAPSTAPSPPDAPLVRVVQPNIGEEQVAEDGYAELALGKLLALSGTAGPRPRLVVWPEGMVNPYVEDGYPPQYYFQGDPRAVRARLAAALGPRDRLLFGGTALFFTPAGQLRGAGNAVFQLDAAGMLGPRYDKAHLVPYGEYLPMRPLLQPLGLARLVMGDVDFVSGPGPQSLHVPGFGSVGMQICYEIIFSGSVVDRAHRPSVLFNPSNDAWFGAWGPPEHLAQARMRAIEEGLPLLRATPTGVSAVVDANGRLLGSVPLEQAGVVEVPLPQPRAPTLFARFGNLLAFVVAGLFAVIAVALRRTAR